MNHDIPLPPAHAKKGGSLRHKFSKTEDEALLKLVEQHGDCNWAAVASGMKNRTPRQCRERYKNYLSPNIKNGPWTPEEEALLEQKYREFGPRWAKIALAFEQRSDVNVKNHWTAMMNKQVRERQMVEQQQVPADVPMYAYPYGHMVPFYTYYTPHMVAMPMAPGPMIQMYPVMQAMPVAEVARPLPPRPEPTPLKKEEKKDEVETLFNKDDGLWAQDKEEAEAFAFQFENTSDTSFDRFL